MKIKSIEFIPLSMDLPAPFRPAWFPGVTVSRRSGTLVKLTTDEGIVGYGWQNSFSTEIKGVGESKFFQELMLNLEVYEVEKAIKILSGFMTRMYAVEVAMWDAFGKSVNQPIYKLLGGARDKVMAYASTAQLKTPKESAADAQRYWDMGFHAVKIRLHNEKMEDDLGVVRAIRDTVPSEMIITVDANQASPMSGPVWTYERAFRTAKELEKLNVLWLEEPLHHEAHEDLARLTKESDILIAGAEDEAGIHAYRNILAQGCFDIVQPDPCTSGGIMQLKKVAAIAESMNRMLIPHSFDTAINLAAALQVVGSVPNSNLVEYALDLPSLDLGHDKLLKNPIEVGRDGYVKIPDGPGLGIEIDEETVSRCRV